MTGAEQFALATELNGSVPIDETLFYQLLNMKKGQREMARDWVVLRTFDNSITFTSADDYEDTKTLPARFLRVYSPTSRDGVKPGIFIVDSAGSPHPLTTIPFVDRYAHKDVDGYCYFDIKNGKVGRTGTLAGTLHLYFLQGTEDIASGSTWSFPSYAHPLLAYDVVISHKGGIDWDTVNANQVPFNAADVRQLEQSLNMWDAQLQQAELGV